MQSKPQTPFPGKGPRNLSMSGRLSLGLGIIVLVLLLCVAVPRIHGSVQPSSDYTPNPSLTDVEFIPETERPLEVCIIGIDPANGPFYNLPVLKKGASLNPSQKEKLQEQVYWLNLELSHGRLLQSLPPRTQLYVAVPDQKREVAANGKEADLLRGYLSKHCRWSQAEIKQRVHIFKSPKAMIWVQDIGKILGKDRNGHWVLFRSRSDLNIYHEGVAALCEAFPDRFVCRELPEGISSEGGDEDLVRDPSGQLIL